MLESSKLIANEREQQRALGFVPEPSDLTELFKETFDEFDSDWAIHDVQDDRARKDLVETEVYGEAQIQLRATADVTVKEELNRLQRARAADYGNLRLLHFTFKFRITRTYCKIINHREKV